MSLAELCVRRPVFATMLVMFLVVLGGFSFFGLGVDLFPKADIPTVNVMVLLPGASPEEVTSQIVLPLEERISSVSGLDELEAMVNEGSARITCRFVLERNIEAAAQDVREKVAIAMKELPPNVEPPVIAKADPDSDPVLTVSIGGQRPLRDITEIADKQIKRVLQTVDGVASIDLVGGQSREIHVVLDAEKLNAHRLTANDVAKLLQSENVETPGGRLFQGPSELAVRTMGRLDAVRQFENLVVATVQNNPVKISDIGQVEDTVEEKRTFALLDGKPAVTLMITRQVGTSTVKVVDDVRRKLAQIQPTLPPGLTVQFVSDQSVFIRASVDALQEHLLLGGLLASLVIFLFIRNWRAVIVSSIAIPTSIIATFTVMKIFDFSLNNMTLLALTLAVGIVIDDAIVVLENIFRHLEEFKENPIEAAIKGTKEISLAVMATTLSLVIIFVPIAFMTGYAKRYLNAFGWTMTAAILVSMLVSFTLTPMLSARVLRREGGGASLSKETRLFTFIERHYERLLRWSLAHPWTIVTVSVLVFLCVIPLNRVVGRDFIPADDQGEFVIHADLPEGVSIEEVMRIGRETEAKLRQVPAVSHVLCSTMGRMQHIHFTVELDDLDKRSLTNVQVANSMRHIMEQIPRVRYKISFPSALGGGDSFGFPIQVQILGPELEKVGTLAQRASDEIRNIPGILTAEPSLLLSSPELRVNIDRDRAADLGVRISDAASAVRLLMSGEDQITTYREAGEQYRVKVVLKEQQRRDRDIMSRFIVPSGRLGVVRLDNIAQITRGASPARITRFNRQFSTPIFVSNSESLPMNEAVKNAGEAMARVGVPAGYTYRFVGSVKALDETTQNLILAFLLATIFMYMVLAAQFESFKHPFIIMLALPLSVPFALLSLYMTGRTLNLWSALGVLLLLGIVKKNAILQVDYTNHLRRQGVELREAILQADRARLRPILMTTFSIIAGLIPTALGKGAGSTQRSAIAVTIIGGQMLCLLLTLILTPVSYELLDRLTSKRAAARGKAWAGEIEGSLEGS
jgi:HAE1 family hydrophobic/amphiphilic exporter-1